MRAKCDALVRRVTRPLRVPRVVETLGSLSRARLVHLEPVVAAQRGSGMLCTPPRPGSSWRELVGTAPVHTSTRAHARRPPRRAVQPWDAANPPDYSVPAQCPFDGHINPLTSGALPDEFKHKTAKDFEPFKPDDTPIEDDTICAAEGAVATEHARGKVLVKDGGTGLCTACPEAKCTIWVPHPDGWYKPECTGVCVPPPRCRAPQDCATRVPCFVAPLDTRGA